MMERGSNQAGGFIRCSVRDLGGKSYNLMFPKGKGLAGGWKILAEKLRQLMKKRNGRRSMSSCKGRRSKGSRLRSLYPDC